jgi:uncharacterized protein
MSELFKKIHDTLPVFQIDNGEEIIFYTPGYYLIIKATELNDSLLFLKHPITTEKQNQNNDLLNLLSKAEEVRFRWETNKKIPFSPECLTIHAGIECNLNCSYCYSKTENTGNKDLSGFPAIRSVEMICENIAEEVRQNSGRLTVVWHGSGEPTWHWHQLVEMYKYISAFSVSRNFRIFNYIATNGCLSLEQVDWLAENMDVIGISCDGPPDIQRMHRSGQSGKYLPLKELTRRIIEKEGRFEVRVTVTKDSISRQSEIVRYLIEELKADTIRIEPVYLAGDNGFQEKDAELFLENYIEALNFADQNGVKLDYAGVRLNELHGTYCDVLRNTLRLTSDGLTRNCFSFMKNDPEFITGRCSETHREFHISSGIDEIKKKTLKIPSECNDCINVYHCSRGCPDYCIYQEKDQQLNSFRCRLHQLITVEEIKACSC